MSDCMNFPDNIMDFIDDYSFEDSDQVYTNGSKLIQSFRVKQAIEHYFREQEPVEPVLDIDTWKCRNCGHDLEHQEMLGDNVLFHEQYNYCPNCGKKVKWDET